MKTKILSLLAILAISLGTTSCHEDLLGNGKGDNITAAEGEGTVNMLSLGIEINNAEKVVVASRAAVDLSDYLIDIVDSKGAKVESWVYSEMPELFTLPIGDYTVQVRSHEVQKAEWERPYFYGEKSFTVSKDGVTEIGVITCKLANIKVTIDYTDELRAVMGDDCKVVVSANDEGSLEFTADETRAGYFEAVSGSTSLVAVFTGTVDGNQEKLTYIATDVEGGQHRKITFKLRSHNATRPDEEGTIAVSGVRLEATVDDIDLNANVSLEEDVLGDSDRPGNEGGSTETEPANDDITFYCATASFDEPNKVSNDSEESVDVVVNIHAVNGIEHLIVTINTTNDDFLLALSDLYMPTTFDLAYPGDKADVYKGLGLPVGDEVLGATSLDFDISQFVPLLGIYPGTHKFQISVTDSKQQQLVKTLTFVVE